MATTQLTLNGALYRFAHVGGLLPKGGRAYSVDSIPWQAGDPAQRFAMTWKLDGPHLFTTEQGSEGQPAGYLGTDYTDGCDTRWTNTLCLGPQLASLSLTGSDITWPSGLFLDGGIGLGPFLDRTAFLDASPNAGPVVDIEVAQATAPGTHYAYFVRDGYVTKVALANLSVVETHSVVGSSLDAIATQQSTTLARELSVTRNGAPYLVVTSIATGTGDTWTTNSANEIVAYFGQSPDRVIALEGQVTVKGNVLTGSVTMAAPNWQVVATGNSSVTGQQVTPTGFATNGYVWVIGTSDGPYVLDPKQGSFYPLIPEIDGNTENCRQMFADSFVGVVIPLRYGTRSLRDGQGASFGVETYPANRSPVQGYPTAGSASLRWLYQAILNPVTNTTYLVAWHPDERETRPGRSLSPFTIGKLSNNAVCRAMNYAGTANGTRSTQVLLMGDNTNARTVVIGDTPQEIDDSNYRYVTSGTWYGTETARFPHLIKDVEAIEVETKGCAAAKTVTLGLQLSTGDTTTTITLNGTTAGVNDVITSSGYQRRLLVDNSGVPLTTATGQRLKPFVTFATNDATASPQCIGVLTVYGVLRPTLLNRYTWYFQLQDDNLSTAYDQLAALQALENSGPVLVGSDHFGDSYYVRVESVSLEAASPPGEQQAPSASPDRPSAGIVLLAKVVAKQWITTGTGP